MKNQTFYERAQALRDRSESGFLSHAVSFIVYQVFTNGDELPSILEFRHQVGVDFKGAYSRQLEDLLDDFGILYDECQAHDAEVFKITNPRFK